MAALEFQRTTAIQDCEMCRFDPLASIVSIGPIEVRVSISVIFQGEGRPDAGWAVPLTVKLFTPESDVLNDAPNYEFKLTTAKPATENAAVCEAAGIAPGTYDITVVGESTLVNDRRSVVISAPNTSVDMGTLLEGDANQDNIVNFDDYAILSKCWLASESQPEHDARTDFDCNRLINPADLYLLTSNWLSSSPIEIAP
jgi:hypothetical protein